MSVSAPCGVRTLSCVSTWRADLTGTLAGNESGGHELFSNYCVKLLNLLDEVRQEVMQKHGKNLKGKKNPSLGEEKSLFDLVEHAGDHKRHLIPPLTEFLDIHFLISFNSLL